MFNFADVLKQVGKDTKEEERVSQDQEPAFPDVIKEDKAKTPLELLGEELEKARDNRHPEDIPFGDEYFKVRDRLQAYYSQTK